MGSHLTSALSCLSIFTYSEGGMWLRVGNNVCKQPFSCQVDPCKGRDIHMLPTAKVPFRHYASVGVVLLLVFPLYPPTLYSVTSKKTPLHFSELFSLSAQSTVILEFSMLLSISKKQVSACFSQKQLFLLQLETTGRNNLAVLNIS